MACEPEGCYAAKGPRLGDPDALPRGDPLLPYASSRKAAHEWHIFRPWDPWGARGKEGEKYSPFGSPCFALSACGFKQPFFKAKFQSKANLLRRG